MPRTRLTWRIAGLPEWLNSSRGIQTLFSSPTPFAAAPANVTVATAATLHSLNLTNPGHLTLRGVLEKLTGSVTSVRRVLMRRHTG
jgi:hypothetical protein